MTYFKKFVKIKLIFLGESMVNIIKTDQISGNFMQRHKNFGKSRNNFASIKLQSISHNHPTFGSAVLSRVVLRNVLSNGDIYFSPLTNKDKGVIGVYKSLAHKISNFKDVKLLHKLASAISDFNMSKPIVASTVIGTRSDFKRYLLTGADAENVRTLGAKFYSQKLDSNLFKDIVSKKIVNNPKNKVFNELGDELGIDLIVENCKGKLKLVDIEISTASNISKYKPPVIKAVSVDPLDTPLKKSVSTVGVKNVSDKKTEDALVQTTFDFLEEIKPKIKDRWSYENS